MSRNMESNLVEHECDVRLVLFGYGDGELVGAHEEVRQVVHILAHLLERVLPLGSLRLLLGLLLRLHSMVVVS